MANPHRGETAADLGGKVYTLCFPTNAQCEVEAVLGITFLQAVGQVIFAANMADQLPARTARALLWGALRRHHSEITLDGAGDMIDAMRPGPASAAIIAAFTASYPELQRKDGPKNPP